MTTTTSARGIELTQRERAADIITGEYTALLAMVRQLTPDQWSLPTDCTEWRVRDLVAHLAGAAEDTVRLTTNLRHLVGAQRAMAREGRRDHEVDDRPRSFVDHLCAAQITDRAQWSDADLLEDLERWAVRSPQARRRVPTPLRRIGMPASSGLRPGADLGYLLDVIGSRDVWMHRIDLSRATGVSMATSPGEVEIVAQVVRDLDLDLDWHGPSFELVLTGRTPGRWQVGRTEQSAPASADAAVTTITADTVGLMRLLSGRPDECAIDWAGDPRVGPAVAEQLRVTRVAF